MTGASAEPPFRVGLNYWPARTAMGWWPCFDRAEVEADFARIAAAGFDSVRLFLTWEHFQPRPETVDTTMIARLVTTLDLAERAGLSVMPTLFTGHMSGVNFLPPWALGGDGGDRRFRVVSGGRVVSAGLINWYTDATVGRAQALLAREVSGALAGHAALSAWDLGNENSNCVVPPTRDDARAWLQRLGEAIDRGDDQAQLTIGLHMEDLEEDRRLGPAEALAVCDFLTMHGYPAYAAWARGPIDEALLPFLAAVTRWLAGGAEVLFSEFGVSTYRDGDEGAAAARAASAPVLVEEKAAARYVARSLAGLRECGCTGAMLWCHADYEAASWCAPPLDMAVHERFFGQWRADASPKPALAAVEAFTRARPAQKPPSTDLGWIDISPDEFYTASGSHLARLYRRYCDAAATSTRPAP